MSLPELGARHREKVEAIARTVKGISEEGGTAFITKRGVHHVVPLPGDSRFRGRPVDISALTEILEIDPATRRCVAEPGVPFGRLVEATLRHGLLPAVVPELTGITVGGAVAGCSVESMSYRVGGFHDNCLSLEIVDGRGQVIPCSPEQDPDVFGMAHGSYGTLGILSALEFSLVPARPFVHLEHRRYASCERFFAALLERCAEGDFDFVDALAHGPDSFVLSLGRFADSAPKTSDYRGLDIFYKSTLARDEDDLDTASYCFRYDTECHWLSRSVPPLEWRPVRALLGKYFLGSDNLIRWSKRLEPLLRLKRRPDVVCDVFIPSTRFEEFFAWYARVFDFYPLWIVPYRHVRPYPWLRAEHAARAGTPLYIDCAIYGKPNGERDVDYSLLLEEKTFELGGLKTLISRNHYTPERFWQIYDRASYERMKRRLDPRGVFPDLYELFHRPPRA
jgi:FAD/FMN-containing dehydrogenase